MRGKERTPALFRVPFGITPAYAGKSRRGLSVSRGQWDHPRLCGEKLLSLVCHAIISGSPPPMRGKVPSPER